MGGSDSLSSAERSGVYLLRFGDLTCEICRTLSERADMRLEEVVDSMTGGLNSPEHWWTL